MMRELENHEYLPPPWTSKAARQIYDSITAQVIQEMIDGDEDPGDTALYLLRRDQVVISLKCYIEDNTREPEGRP